MPRCLASAKHSWQRSLTILKTAAHTCHRARANSGTTAFIGLSEQAVAREPDQCLEAFLAFLPLCLSLPTPFLALPLTTLALCLTFLPTPMTDSLLPWAPTLPTVRCPGRVPGRNRGTRRSGGCHVPRRTRLKLSDIPPASSSRICLPASS